MRAIGWLWQRLTRGRPVPAVGEPSWVGPWLAHTDSMSLEDGLCPICWAERVAQSSLVSAVQRGDPGPPEPWSLCSIHLEACRRAGLSMVAAPETMVARQKHLTALRVALEAARTGHGIRQLARARAALCSPEPCPLCEVGRWAACRAAARCRAMLEEQGRAASQAARVLCARHLPDVLAGVSLTAIEWVCQEQEERVLSLVAEIAEYFRKVDYRYAHEPKGEEQGAWLRGIAHAAGLPPWPHEIPAEVRDG